jgi:DNA-directed RNA polymerase subunit beta
MIVQSKNKNPLRLSINRPLDILHQQHILPALHLQFNSKEEFFKEGGLLEKALSKYFPISNTSNSIVLDYLGYKIENPLLDIKQCITNDLTYDSTIKIHLKLTIKKDANKKPTVSKHWVYLVDIPIMTDVGSYIINGSERSFILQIHRSIGITFLSTFENQNNSLIHMARLIPTSGSWFDFILDQYDRAWVRLSKKTRKFSLHYLMVAMGMKVEEILKAFSISIHIFRENSSYTFLINDNLLGKKLPFDLTHQGTIICYKDTLIDLKTLEKIKKTISSHSISNTYLLASLVKKETSYIPLNEEQLSQYEELDILLPESNNYLFSIYQVFIDNLNMTQEEAQLYFYNTAHGVNHSKENMENIALKYYQNIFQNKDLYSLEGYCRNQMNYSIGNSESHSSLLEVSDLVLILKKLLRIKHKEDQLDDIDDLAFRSISLVSDSLYKKFLLGMYRIRNVVVNYLNKSNLNLEEITINNIFNTKPLCSLVRELFVHNPLCQLMDQTNPLSEIAHKRRVTVLGPGGMSRDRVAAEVRDVHTSHYGRLCVTETPEGQNIGLINALAHCARINKDGFIESPYIKISNGYVTNEVRYLNSSEEKQYRLIAFTYKIDKDNLLLEEEHIVRYKNEVETALRESIDFMDLSSNQIFSISTSLIPFVEHNDANRALMGSNMQRQAIPSSSSEAPLIGTGLEKIIAQQSYRCVTAKRKGTVYSLNSSRIIIENKENTGNLLDFYDLNKYVKSNKSIPITQRVKVDLGQEINKDDLISDSSSIHNGELALGHNILVAYVPLHGYTFEDSIVVSEKVIQDNKFHSIHLEKLSCSARETKSGVEEITRDIPNITNQDIRNLDERGIIRIGAVVQPGDILVGKITPQAERQLNPEEKLLFAVFGDNSFSYKETSLRTPIGLYGRVINIHIREENNEAHITDMLEILEEKKEIIKEFLITKLINKHLINGKKILHKDLLSLQVEEICQLTPKSLSCQKLLTKASLQIKELNASQKEIVNNKNKIQRKLNPAIQVVKVVTVTIAKQSFLQLGDKLSGRHGNKGIVSRISPVEDMPYMKDGTPVDMVLTPIGIPSRMNIGQLFEALLGFASLKLGKLIQKELSSPNCTAESLRIILDYTYNKVAKGSIDFSQYNDEYIWYLSKEVQNGIPIAVKVFSNQMKEEYIKEILEATGSTMKTDLYDGYTGRKLYNDITVGVIYMLKLDHLIDSKIHARSIGPYGLISQQPLGGKLQFGGQRVGEMEVLAIQAYGASYILQEMLTVKSDDIIGRNKLYQDIIDGNLSINPNLPESFYIMQQTLQALGFKISWLYED